MKEKALFLIGTFGSGKNIILEKVLNNYNIPEFTLEQVESALTTKLSKNDKKNAILHKESIVITTNSIHYSKIKIIKETLEQFGYETSMILVDANKNILLNRIQKRENFDKSLYEEKISKSKRTKPRLEKLFSYYVEYDNSFDYNSQKNLDGITVFVEEFFNKGFTNIIEQTTVITFPKKKYSIKKSLLGSKGDRILGTSSKVSVDGISQDYAIRGSGIGYPASPSTVGPFYSESYASDPGVSLPAFSSVERSTPPTEYYSNEPPVNYKKKLTIIKKIAKEKDDVNKV